jgi:hypothetical protein
MPELGRQVSLILRMSLKRATPSFTVEHRQARRPNSGGAKPGWAHAKPVPAGLDEKANRIAISAFTLGEQRRLDRKNVIARDVPERIDAFENNMQRGRVAFGDIRHAESSARVCSASNAKFESAMPIRFQKLMDGVGSESGQSDAQGAHCCGGDRCAAKNLRPATRSQDRMVWMATRLNVLERRFEGPQGRRGPSTVLAQALERSAQWEELSTNRLEGGSAAHRKEHRADEGDD